MISSMAYLATLVAVESVILILSALKPGPYSIRGRVIELNMLVIAVFGSIITSAFGMTTNVANINYAAVVLSQVLILEIYGTKEARNTIPMVLGTVVAFTVMAYCVLHFWLPDSGTSGLAYPLRDLLVIKADVILASLLAFTLSTEITRRSWPSIRRTAGGPLAAVALGSIFCQAVDTPLFFTMAFQRALGVHELMGVMVSGFLAKIIATLALLPAAAAVLRIKKAMSGCVAEERALVLRTKSSEPSRAPSLKLTDFFPALTWLSKGIRKVTSVPRSARQPAKPPGRSMAPATLIIDERHDRTRHTVDMLYGKQPHTHTGRPEHEQHSTGLCLHHCRSLRLGVTGAHAADRRNRFRY